MIMPCMNSMSALVSGGNLALVPGASVLLGWPGAPGCTTAGAEGFCAAGAAAQKRRKQDRALRVANDRGLDLLFRSEMAGNTCDVSTLGKKNSEECARWQTRLPRASTRTFLRQNAASRDGPATRSWVTNYFLRDAPLPPKMQVRPNK